MVVRHRFRSVCLAEAATDALGLFLVGRPEIPPFGRTGRNVPVLSCRMPLLTDREARICVCCRAAHLGFCWSGEGSLVCLSCCLPLPLPAPPAACLSCCLPLPLPAPPAVCPSCCLPLLLLVPPVASLSCCLPHPDRAESLRPRRFRRPDRLLRAADASLGVDELVELVAAADDTRRADGAELALPHLRHGRAVGSVQLLEPLFGHARRGAEEEDLVAHGHG